MNKSEMQGLGGLLITIALTPTPDDVTIISPALQLLIGTGLIIAGSMKKK